jgi:negative regulator of flagellin synthesis FlgM
MQIYGPYRVSTTPINAAAQRAQPQPPAGGVAKVSSAPIDRLDLSSTAAIGRPEVSGPIAGGGEIRTDRVAEIRRQIAAGSYETPEKLNAALERMLDQLA